jgi:hypothetical protein
MSLRKALLPLVLVFTISAVALVFIFRNFVRQAIAIPISYAYWLTDQILRSVDPSVFWGLLLIVLTIAVFISLPPILSEPVRITAAQASGSGGRMRYWARQLRSWRGGQIPKTYSGFEVRRLVLDVLAFRQQCTTNEVAAMIETGALEVPAELSAIFLKQPDESKVASGFGVFWQRLVDKLNELLGRELNDETKLKASADLEVILQYLEKQLEAKS